MKKLILLDNNKNAFNILSGLLFEQYELYQAVTLNQLYDALEKYPAALLLVNVDMPNHAAMQMLSSLRNTTKATANAPAIFMVSEVTPDFLQKMKTLGGVDLIKKPFEPLSFLERIENAFNITADDRDSVTGLYKKIYFVDIVSDMFANGTKGFVFTTQIDSRSFVSNSVDIQTLKKCIKLITHNMPPDTILGIDGNTILGFVANLVDKTEVKAKVDTMIEAMRVQMEISGIKIYSAVGIAIHDKDEEEFNELYSYADKAMAISRQNGKNCAYFFR